MLLMEYQIFIFRRDLRIEDNTTLNRLFSHKEPVIPIFIFDPQQIDPKKNQYFSSNCVQFMCESLEDLEKNISKQKGHLNYFHGDPIHVLEKIIRKNKIVRIGVNRDYTPFSKSRDEKISTLCLENKIEFVSEEDICILPVGSIRTGSGTIYKKFTPFYHKCLLQPVPNPSTKKSNFSSYKIGEKLDIHKYYIPNSQILHHGGRHLGLEQLEKLPKDYPKTHDIPSIPTTQLSAYNKFGCISIRELMKKLSETKNVAIARQLYFRDFYYNIVEYYPEILSKGLPFEKKWQKIRWDKPSPKYLTPFENGKTGFPIIDAGIRQMITTGFMHNRVRMLVASFLSKDLLYDWRIGEKFFAKNLYDYDPIQNNSGWQTVAGTGASALEWFRVMNPWTQTEKFDPECKYIKTWIPEFQNTPPEKILNWNTDWDEKIYPKPIVNHEERRDIMLKRYREL